ncbi:MAG TPA: glucoamylase [Kribbellaceae bacterium]
MRDSGGRAMHWYSTVVLATLLAVLAGGFAWSQQRLPRPDLVTDTTFGGGRSLQEAEPERQPDLLSQAVADLRQLTLPNGAAIAGPHGPWRYVWPRDASFVAAAYCASGDIRAGLRVLGFLDRVRPSQGRWAARYRPDGSGPVADRRGPQLDDSGWVPWAVGTCAGRASYDELAGLFGMVRQSADQAAAELGDNGLPAASPDYWERPERRTTIGVAAPLLAGLRSATAVADRLGHTAEASRWRVAAVRLEAAIDRVFGPRGYPRTRRGGADSMVTVLGPPFAPARDRVSAAIERSRRLLTLPNGGVTPGQDWRADGVAWTPSTGLFGLSAAARGDRATARQVLDLLAAHRTATGALPEKIGRTGKPGGEAPLAWTCALVVLIESFR